MTDRRALALSELEGLGVSLGESGDVEALKRAILARRIRPIRLGRQNSCLRKQRYESALEARKGAHRTTNAYVRPYRCGHCRMWHIGNAPRRLK